MNFDKVYLVASTEFSHNRKCYVEDGEGLHMPYRDFHRQYIGDKMCEATLRKRLQAGQSVADALARKPVVKRVPFDSAGMDLYLMKHLNKYRNTIVSAGKVKNQTELEQRLYKLGYNYFDIRLVKDDTSTIGETNKFYVIQLRSMG